MIKTEIIGEFSVWPNAKPAQTYTLSYAPLSRWQHFRIAVGLRKEPAPITVMLYDK